MNEILKIINKEIAIYSYNNNIDPTTSGLFAAKLYLKIKKELEYL